MKKHLYTGLCLLIIGGLFSGLGYSIHSSDDQAAKIKEGKALLEKVIKAMGGRDALSKIKDMTTMGDIEMTQMGLEGSVTMYLKEPNKMRMDIEIMGMMITQAYDGEVAWMINPQTGATEEMPEQYADDFRRQSWGNDMLLNPEKHGVTYTYEGKETIEDKEYFVLLQTHSDGFTSKMFIDPETHLTFMTRAKTLNQLGMDVEGETFTTDYKEFQGTMVPYTITSFQDGEEFMTMTVTDVTYNSGLEDSFFKMDG
jgi:outer membrane lipoprotein-sorting protein